MRQFMLNGRYVLQADTHLMISVVIMSQYLYYSSRQILDHLLILNDKSLLQMLGYYT